MGPADALILGFAAVIDLVFLAHLRQQRRKRELEERLAGTLRWAIRQGRIGDRTWVATPMKRAA